MTESSMSIRHCIKIDIFLCKIGFDDETVLIYFIGISSLHSLFCTIRISLFNDTFRLFNRQVRTYSLSLLIIY